MIDLALIGNWVTFDIDNAAASEGCQIISSKFLALARSINRK